MVDELAVAVIEVEEEVADRAHLHQRDTILVADEVEAECRRPWCHCADAEQGHVEALGTAQDVAQAAAFDQRFAGLRRIHHGRGLEEEAVGADHAGKLPGEFRRVELAGLDDAAEQGDDLHVLEFARREGLQRLVERRTPADPDRHVIGEDIRNIHAGGNADRLGDMLGQGGFGHHHGILEAEDLLQFRLEFEALGDIAFDPDLDFALADRLVDVAHHGDAADTQLVGNLVLRQSFDIVHPGDAHAVARNAARPAILGGRSVLADRGLVQHSVRRFLCSLITCRLPASSHHKDTIVWWKGKM